MQLREVLSVEQIAILKTMGRTRVFRVVKPIEDFRPPQRDSGRKVLGGSRPSDLSKSSMLHCVEYAEVYGLKGGLSKKVVFERPKTRKIA